jgi:nitroreductase
MDVDEAIHKRFSCRSYRSEPVPDELVRKVLEAGRLAPSACNKQPWRFAVVTDHERRRRIVEECFLPGIRMDWALAAPVHIVLGMARSIVTHMAAPAVSGVDYPWVDLGIAGEHMVLQATELGLGTCWIGWIKPRAVRTVVDWPGGVKPVALITLGYPADEEGREKRQSKRKPLSDITKWI